MTILFSILLGVGAALIVLPIVLIGKNSKIQGETGILIMAIGFLLFIVGMIGVACVG